VNLASVPSYGLDFFNSFPALPCRATDSTVPAALCLWAIIANWQLVFLTPADCRFLTLQPSIQ